MTLIEWLSSTPQGQQWTTKTLAEAIGASVATVACWRSGKYIAQLRFQRKIGELTQGQVMPNDWFPEREMWKSAPAQQPSQKRRTRRRTQSTTPASADAPTDDRIAA